MTTEQIINEVNEEQKKLRAIYDRLGLKGLIKKSGLKAESAKILSWAQLARLVACIENQDFAGYSALFHAYFLRSR